MVYKKTSMKNKKDQKKTLKPKGKDKGGLRSSTLLKCLQNCSPALPEGFSESNAMHSSLFCFKFQDGRVSAFNDEILISCPTPEGIDLSVGVNGKTLLSSLSFMPDKQVKLNMEKQTGQTIESNMVELQCGNSNIKIPTVAIDSFMDMNTKQSKKSVQFDFDASQIKAFSKSISDMMCSIIRNSVEHTFRGAWLFIEDGNWNMYSSNGWSISRATIVDANVPAQRGDKTVPSKMFFPLPLMQAFVDYTKNSDSKKMVMSIDPKWIQLDIDGMCLHGRQIQDTDRIRAIPELLKEHKVDGKKKDFTVIPKDLKDMVRLSMVFAGSVGQNKVVSLDIGDGSMRMMAGNETTSGIAEHSEIKFEGHDTRQVHFNPEVFLAATSNCDKIRFTEGVAIMTGTNFHYMFTLMSSEDN